LDLEEDEEDEFERGFETCGDFDVEFILAVVLLLLLVVRVVGVMLESFLFGLSEKKRGVIIRVEKDNYVFSVHLEREREREGERI
jgi:hypothetical protein